MVTIKDTSKDTDEECIIHSKSDNTEVINYDEPEEISKEFFESPLSRY